MMIKSLTNQNKAGGQNKETMKIFFFSFIFFSSIFINKINAYAIYDNEIENFVSDIIIFTYPKKRSIDNIDLTIILDDTPNAYINEKNNIFVTTGLLKYIENVEALIGVIAHEIGHIENYHISKRKKSITKLKLINQLGNLTAIATSIITKDPNILMQTAISNQVGINNYYSSFSRDQEREADIFAIDRLNDLSISSKYLTDFLIFLESEDYKKGRSGDQAMFSTHPNYTERLNLISQISNQSKRTASLETKQRFNYIKGKLLGYTEKDFAILDDKLTGNALKYAKSIMYSNRGNLLKSLKIINQLIDSFPDNYYFTETKADILYNHSYTNESKKFYEIALSKNKKNHYIEKRLFEIKYKDFDFKDMENGTKIFIDHQNLIFIFSNDLLFYEKWNKLLFFLGKENWLLFVKAKKDLIKNDVNAAKQKLEKILINSNNKKLIKNCKKILDYINE